MSPVGRCAVCGRNWAGGCANVHDLECYRLGFERVSRALVTSREEGRAEGREAAAVKCESFGLGRDKQIAAAIRGLA